MTAGRSWIAFAAVVVAVVCGLGALAAYVLVPGTASPRVDQLAKQIDRAITVDDLNALEQRLPKDSTVLVSMSGPRAAEPGRPSASPVPDTSPTGSPPSDSNAGSVTRAPGPSGAGAATPPSEGTMASRTAPTAPSAAVPPSTPPRITSASGHVRDIEDGAALAEEFVKLGQTNDVVTYHRDDGLWLAVGTPKQAGSTGTPLLAAVIAALTGLAVAVAVAVALSGRPGRSGPIGASAAAPPPTGQPPSPDRLPLNGPGPPPARPAPGPRHAAQLAASDGEASAGRVLAPNPPEAPSLDPEATALLAQQRTLLAKRTTLLRGLADLLVRLPDESAWQAARLLEAAGARQIVPEPGTPFDPALHHVLDVESTTDASFDDTVARTLRAGWRDQEQDQVLVPAHVVLYALPDPAERGFDDDR